MNEKRNIQNLIDLLAQRQGTSPQETEKFVRAFFALIEEGLERDKYVKIKKLGTFKLIDVDSRESVDVNTGERIEIQEHTKVSFSPDSSLKEVINAPFAHFETVILNENTVLEDTPLENADEKEIKEEMLCSLPAEDKAVTESPSGELSVESVPQPVKTESEDTPDDNNEDVAQDLPYPIPPSNRMKSFITLVVLFIAVLGGGIFFICNPDFFVRPVPPPEEPRHIAAGQEKDFPQETPLSPVADSVRTDSIQEPDRRPETDYQSPMTSDAAGTEKEKKEEPAGKTAKKRAVSVESRPLQAFVPDSTSYEIVGTKTKHILAVGETLTRVALKYYGTKTLWPYLVKYNPDVIKNPDNVPSGTVIKVPELRKKK